MDSEKFATSVEDRFLQLYMVVSTGGQGGIRNPHMKNYIPLWNGLGTILPFLSLAKILIMTKIILAA